MTVTLATKHNGGRSQTNLNGLQVGGEYPFINVMKTCSDFVYVSDPNKDNIVDPSVRDSDGYPTSVQAGGYYTILYIPSAADLPGDYVMSWDGNGTVGVPGSIVTGSATSSGGSGSLTFTPSGQRLTPTVVSTSASPNHIRNIQIYHNSESSRLASGEIFGAKFMSRLQEANFGVIRFLNWQVGSNTGNVTTWSLRTPMTYYSYGDSKWVPSLYFTMTNSGNAYSVTTGRGRAPIHGDIIQGTINASATQSGTCSLNADGTGAVNILSIYSDALSVGGNTYPIANLAATFVYDATLNAWIKHGGDLGFRNTGILSGVPVEACLQLCAQLGAHPWFVSPHLTCDPMTDFLPSTMKYVFDNKPSWMTPRFEPPNELWNSRFPATGYANAKAAAYVASAGWASSSYHAWYGKALSTLGQAAAVVFNSSNLGTTYHVVGGVQTGTYTSPSSNDERFISTSYVGQSSAVQSALTGSWGTITFTKSASYNWTSHLGCAQYWNPSLQFDSTTEQIMATQYAAALSRDKASIAYAYSDSCTSGTTSQQIAIFPTISGNFKTYLLALPVPIRKICGYEGCYSPDYVGDTNLDIMRYASRSNPNLGGCLLAVYAGYTSVNDSTFTAEFPSNFILGDFNPNGTGLAASGTSSYIWSIFPSDIWSVGSPQWDAICRYNSPKRATPLRMRLHT